MKVEITYETQGIAPAGVDLGELEKDIRAEVFELSSHLEAETAAENKKPAPRGAQGEHLLVEWIIEVAKDPAMIPAYVRTFAYAMNALLSPGQEKKAEKSDGQAQSSLDFERNSPKCHIKFAGKTLLLPAAVVVIKKFFEES